MPTRKWWAATITGILGLSIMILTGDSAITDPEVIAIGTFVGQRAVAWLIPNDTTPGEEV